MSHLLAHVAPSTVSDRLGRFAKRIGSAGADAAVVAPGPDMQYLLGRSIPSHERLTALVVPAAGSPALLVPALERQGWVGSPVEELAIPIATWRDGDDPYAALSGLLPNHSTVLCVDYHMPAVHALSLQSAIVGSELRLAGDLLAQLRMRKDTDEINAIVEIGAAIDRVHGRIGEWLRPGRTENDVAADIAAAIVAEGHARADFVIVGSGPNGASPHHEASDRVIGEGEAVVVDIGGPAPSGYNSDSTRTYVTAGAAPDPELLRVHEIVQRAQAAGVAAARPGVAAESIDAAARDVIEAAGYGEYFITRTGHGIGLEVHEHPYMVAGNTQLLEPSMAFSVEPGIYLPGRFGVRIEDIAIVTDTSAMLCNNTPTDLMTVG